MRLIASGLFLIASATLFAQGFGGPSVMGAPTVTAGGRTGAETGYRFFAEATGIYNNQLVPVATDPNGENIQSGAVFGGDIRVGLYGVKRFRHAQIGINYLGGYRKYSGSYDRQTLKSQVRSIKQQLSDGRDVFAYFNNDAEGYALKNAAELKQYVTG